LRGVLFLVVGPSGVGKDTLIDAARARLEGDPDFLFQRRAVTRPAGSIGEDHEPMSAAAFDAAEAAGAFFVSWRAHGLAYGIRRTALDALANGQNVVVNVSRGVVRTIAARVPGTIVLSVTAPPEVVRARLEARGREDAADVAARLARSVPLDDAARVIEVSNDGSLEIGVARFLDALLGAALLPLRVRRAAVELSGEPMALVHVDAPAVAAARLAGVERVEIATGSASVRARLAVASDEGLVGLHEIALSPAAFERLGVGEGTKALLSRSPSPASRDLLRRKVAGEELTAAEIDTVVRDLVDGRYAPAEIAGFLVAASTNLSLAEVTALTRARAALVQRFNWDGRTVVDKHSMGGVPGSRITPVVVAIAAAHGLTMPKTSSRAITSAAGTADVMECAARVDLSPAELRAVVERAGGAIAWSGRISHSALDDVMNAVNLPLGIRSAALDVSSILSKKLAVGSTHVVVDIPVGPLAKTRTKSAGRELARLFEAVGREVGITVVARLTDGSAPIGHGVGPALELADVLAVLSDGPDAPAALRQKAVAFAADVLAFAGVNDPCAAADEALRSGAAAAAFHRIADAQGGRERVRPGLFRRILAAPRAGRVEAIDGFAVASLARGAGAPGDKAAGVRLIAGIGSDVRQGEPLLEVVASREAALGALDGTGADLVRVA
jgi:thymidine phosphorylase